MSRSMLQEYLSRIVLQASIPLGAYNTMHVAVLVSGLSQERHLRTQNLYDVGSWSKALHLNLFYFILF